MHERILTVLKRLLSDTEIGITTDLRDLGMTSLTFMAFLAELGDSFQIGLNMADLRENPTVSDLEKLILSKPKTGAEYLNKDRYPMFPTQIFLYDDMLRMNSPENVLLSLLEMDKGIDINRLKQAVANAIKIHPILFTRIERGAGTEAFCFLQKKSAKSPRFPLSRSQKRKYLLSERDWRVSWPILTHIRFLNFGFTERRADSSF